MRRKKNDGGMTIPVNVTLLDGHNGRACSCGSCPIALALKRAIKRAFPNINRPDIDSILAVHVALSGMCVFVTNSGYSEIVMLTPAKADAYIIQFDAGFVKPRPISFPVYLDQQQVAVLRSAS